MAKQLACTVALLILSSASFGNNPFPEPLVPADNPSSVEKTKLGHDLFGETALSINGKFSCATCHQPARHFTDGLKVAIGALGEPHRFNTPTLYNTAYNASLGWQDEGLERLETQHLVPLTNQQPVEMGFHEGLIPTLEAKYATRFAAVFGDERITLERITKAIASYVRTLRAPSSAFDRYVYWDEPLNATAKEGMALFFSERLGCSHCHGSFNLSGPVRHEFTEADPVFHVTGVASSDEAFRAPTLRAIRHTAPYMHAGNLDSLEAVIHHYETTDAERVPDFVLSDKERNALIAFLNAL